MSKLKKRTLLSILLCMVLLTACQAAAPEPSPGPEENDVSALPEDAVPPEEVSAPDPGSPDPAADPEPVDPSQPEAPAPDPEPATDDPEPPAPPAPPEPAPEPVQVNHRLYVLMYHSIVPDGTTCNTWMRTESQFRSDLQWLSDNGYSTVLPSELAAGQPLPERAVLLTLDDGYRDNYTIAYPLLQEFRAKAVISLVVSFLDRQDPNCLTWDMCADMISSGLVEIGSHTYDCHNGSEGIRRLKDESREEYEARVLTDIQTSIDLIEENLDTEVQFFAYPNGITETWASDYLEEHFAVTVTTRYGSTDISDGLYNMNRCNISAEEPPSFTLPRK